MLNIEFPEPYFENKSYLTTTMDKCKPWWCYVSNNKTEQATEINPQNMDELRQQITYRLLVPLHVTLVHQLFSSSQPHVGMDGQMHAFRASEDDPQ